jgi:hypothetical protein
LVLLFVLQRRGDTAADLVKQVFAAPLQNKKENLGCGLGL